MESQENLVTPLFEKMQEYGETSYELVKLKTVEKTVRLLSGVVTRIVILFVSVMFLLFFSLALAIWLGALFGEMYLGFACLALVYALFGGMLVLFFKKWLKQKFANAMVNNIFN